jgi:hypothetical protein
MLTIYGGTLVVSGLLFGSWTFAQRWILGTGPSDGVEVVA